MSDNKTVGQLRAMFFGHTLAEVAGFEPTGAAITRWGNAWWARRTGRALPDPLNHKWADYLMGRLPRSGLREALIEDFPILQTVLDDPLWPLLERLLHPLEDTGCWATQLRLNGHVFCYFSAWRLERLCGVPNWRRLAGLLALLGSERTVDYWSRVWLRRVLTDYVLCACLDLPGRIDPRDLYALLEEANHLGKFGQVNNWATSGADFQHQLARFKRIRRRLQAKGWLQGWGFSERLLFWRLLGNRDTLARLLTSAPTVGLTRGNLVRQTRHWLRQAQRDQVSFAETAPGAWRWCDSSRGHTQPFAWVIPRS